VAVCLVHTTQGEVSESKTIELNIIRPGVLNAIAFWFSLIGDKEDGNTSFYSTSPLTGTKKSAWKQAVQYLEGEIWVNACMSISLKAVHNSFRIRFELVDAEYSNFFTKTVAAPKYLFNR
jgi:hypothetical protein